MHAQAAARNLKRLEAGWAKAKAQFADPQWAPSWADWHERLAQVKKKLEQTSRAFDSSHR